MEIGHGQFVVDHAAEDGGNGRFLDGVDFDEAAKFGGLFESDVWREVGPFAKVVGFLGEPDLDEGGASAAAAQALGGTVVDDLSLIDEKQGVAHLVELGKDVGTDEDGLALLGENADEVLELDAGFGVETGGGFVENEDVGIVKQGTPKAESLAHAFAEFVAEPVGEAGKIGELHDLGDALDSFFAAITESASKEVEILQHGHVAVGAVVVGHPADAAADFGGIVDDVDSADFGSARVRVVERRENAHRGRFSRSIGTDEPDDLAALDGEGNVVDSFDSAVEPAGEILHLDSGRLRCLFGITHRQWGLNQRRSQ